MNNRASEKFVLYMRNFIFGAEDSLVSTVGLLAGVSVGGVSSREIVLTGIVLIFVEAFSMGIGSFLSEYESEEYVDGETKVKMRNPMIASVIMFFSYLVSGLVPLLPYVFAGPILAFRISIAASLIALFFLGVISSKVMHVHLLKNGLRMMIFGGIAVGVGVFIGQILQNY